MPPLDLADVLGNARDQNRGRWFDILDPVTGAPTGIKLQVAGPDSETQRRAQLRMVDRLAELADPEGRVSAEAREQARIEALAECILDWEVVENGQSLPHNFRNVVRALKLARWLEQQADRLAGDRALFWEPR
jgi:hypothetical protein